VDALITPLLRQLRPLSQKFKPAILEFTSLAYGPTTTLSKSKLQAASR